MTTSEEWAERLSGYIPDDGMKPKLRKFAVTWTVEGEAEIEAETADDAEAFFSANTRHYVPDGNVIIHCVDEVERSGVDVGTDARVERTQRDVG